MIIIMRLRKVRFYAVFAGISERRAASTFEIIRFHGPFPIEACVLYTYKSYNWLCENGFGVVARGEKEQPEYTWFSLRFSD